MLDCWWYISPMLPLSISEKEKLGNPKEEIGNLKMDLNMCILMISKYNICKLNTCVLVILRYNISNLNILHIHISYFCGTTLFPSMARLALPLMNKQKLDPKRFRLQLT
jgi:hypothetical protein